MKKILFSGLFLLFLVASVEAQNRREIAIPDIDGYKTLKCDFHMHTVFSDGLVWPTVRIDEAYKEGLDAIAFTEHIEYRPHKADIVADHNRSFDLCEKYAANRDLLLIRGSEITRPMAPGQFNAIFLENSNALEQKEWRDAFKEAKKQGAFIFWNHPGWEKQQPDTTLWFPEHTELLEMGCMDGIEVINGRLYTPEAMDWCEKYNLTMLGTSDIHQPIQVDYDFAKGEHRPVTLVFAKERSLQGIREALDNRRTAIYWGDNLIGKEVYLKQLFEKSFKVEKVTVNEKNARIEVYNDSDVPFILKKHNHPAGINYFRDMVIKPHSHHVIVVTLEEGVKHGNVEFEVTNFWVARGKGMMYSLSF